MMRRLDVTTLTTINYTATYLEAFQLDVIASGITIPVNFTIHGAQNYPKTTPYSDSIPFGQYTLEATTLTSGSLRFKRWVDVVSGTLFPLYQASIQIDLRAPLSLAIEYELVAPFDFSVSATPSSQTVPAGAQYRDYAVTVSHQGAGPDGDVTLTAAPPPNGGSLGWGAGETSSVIVHVTATTPGTATLRVRSTSLSPAPSTTTIIITGTSGTLPQRTASVEYKINAAFTFNLAVDSSSVDITAGSQATQTVRAHLLSGETPELVTLSLTGLPSGFTHNFNPNPVTPEAIIGAPSTLTITAPSNATEGSYTIHVSGNSASASDSVDFTLVVHLQQVFDFHVTANPSTVNLTAGASGVTITITATLDSPPTQSITLQAPTNLPSGVTATAYSPNPITPSVGGATSTTTLTADASAQTSSQTIVIHAVGGGLDKTVNITLNVAGLPPIDYTLQAVPATQTVQTGQTSNAYVITAQLVPQTQTENVVLTVYNLPEGASYAFSPSNNGSPTFSRNLTITAPSGIAVETTYHPVVRGTSSPHNDIHEVPLTLIVTPLPSPFNFNVNVSPSTQDVTKGNSTPFTVAVNRTSGQTSEFVTLSVKHSLPAGVSIDFGPALAYPGGGTPPFSQQMNVSTTSATPEGPFDIVVTGDATSVTDVNAPKVTVTVNPIANTGTIVVTANEGETSRTDGSGEIYDPSNTLVHSFTSTPHPWNEAQVGVQYRVVCRLSGYADRTQNVTLTYAGESKPADFVFYIQSGFPIWVVAAGVGLLVITTIGSWLAGGKKK